jgi:hypothetical protein
MLFPAALPISTPKQENSLKTISKRSLQLPLVTAIAIFTTAMNAGAGTITFATNAPGTEFVSPMTGLVLDDSSGLKATLTFDPDAQMAVGLPSNINYGTFTLACAACLTNKTGVAHFAAFTFDLIVGDVTNGAKGEFVGTSAGGNVAFNSSAITIVWSQEMLGPGTSGALAGNFDLTEFEISSPTRIVAPNSGENGGETTVQGDVASASVTSQAPEAGTMTMIGAGLIGLGLLRRRAFRK